MYLIFAPVCPSLIRSVTLSVLLALFPISELARLIADLVVRDGGQTALILRRTDGRRDG